MFLFGLFCPEQVLLGYIVEENRGCINTNFRDPKFVGKRMFRMQRRLMENESTVTGGKPPT